MQVHVRFHLSFSQISVGDSLSGYKVLRQRPRNPLGRNPLWS